MAPHWRRPVRGLLHHSVFAASCIYSTKGSVTAVLTLSFEFGGVESEPRVKDTRDCRAGRYGISLRVVQTKMRYHNPSVPDPTTTRITSHFHFIIPMNAMAPIASANQSNVPRCGKST